MAKIDFDPSQVEPDTGNFDPLPPGDYVCQIIDSEVKPTKSGNGEILKLVSRVEEGEHTGRLIFDNLNISNPNADAERISKQSLRALCDAIGITGHVEDSEVLHFKQFIGRVTIRQDKSGQFGPKNAIRYRPLHPTAQEPMKVQPIRPATVTGQQQAAAAGGSRPWIKPTK